MLKDKSFWLVKPAANSSWNWRKLLQLRRVIRPLIKFNVGNGEKILFWIDDWHPSGQLLSIYPTRVVFNSGISLYARLSSVITDGTWTWPPARTCELSDIINSLDHMLPSPLPDTIAWLLSTSKSFHLGSTWNAIRNPHPKVPWFSLVWVKRMIT